MRSPLRRHPVKQMEDILHDGEEVGQHPPFCDNSSGVQELPSVASHCCPSIPQRRRECSDSWNNPLLLWSQQSAVSSSSWICPSPCLSHFTPGPHLQSCSPDLHLQSTPLHKPLDSLLSVPDRTTRYCGNDTCLAPVKRVLSFSRLL